MDHHDQPSRELSRRTLGAGRFLTLQAIHWRDAHGAERVWETADRNGGRPAVMIIAWLMPSRRLVLIRQYRPPARGFVVEFPAGIMDEHENVEQAALRELREETGYTGRVTASFNPAFNTPGLSNDAAHAVMVEIDEASPHNLNPTPNLKDDEELAVVLVPRDQLSPWLQAQQKQGTLFDAKVVAYIVGLM